MEPFSKEIASRLAETRALGMTEVTRVFALELAKRPAAARRDLAAGSACRQRLSDVGDAPAAPGASGAACATGHASDARRPARLED